MDVARHGHGDTQTVVDQQDAQILLVPSRKNDLGEGYHIDLASIGYTKSLIRSPNP
jgi:hypothetical protein